MKRALLLALLLAAWPVDAVVLLDNGKGVQMWGFTLDEVARVDAGIAELMAERDALRAENKALREEVNKLRLERQIPPFPRVPLVDS